MPALMSPVRIAAASPAPPGAQP